MTPIGTPAFRALLGACNSWLSQGAWQPPAEAVDWHRLGRLGFFHNLEPLLHRLAEERRLPVAEIPADVLATWESAHYRNYLFNTRALEILDRLARAADESSLPFAVFKGPVTLARVYGDPALRMMVDLDLILRRRDLEPLTRLAAGLGFCDGGHLHPLHTITTHPKLGLALELHFDLYDFLLRRDELVDRVLEARVELEIDGRSFPAAPPELALVLEIGHLVQHDFRIGLRNWLDLAALLGAAHAPLDWHLLRTALATHGLLDEFLLAVEVTTRLFGRPPAAVPFVRASGYAEQARAGVIEQVAHIDRGVERAALQELAQRRGLGAKLSYLGHRLLPTGSRWRALKAGRGTRSALATLGHETIQSAARELARWRTAGLAVRGGSIKAAVHTRNRRRRAEEHEPMRVFLSNLGCKLNQAELEELARRFAAAGHEIVRSLAAADLHVVNSCTVTHAAARDSRKLARRGRRLRRRLMTVLTGCHVDADPAAAAALAGVDLVVPNADKGRLVERVHQAFPETLPAGGDSPLPVPYVPLAFGNARALVKIEDGCNMRCAFCIIPFTRGAQRSRPAEVVARDVAGLAAAGFGEVVLTGVQISSYRDGEKGLFELVERLLTKTAGPRLRLTSIAPWELDRRLLGLFAGGRLCRHFHLSLQSGCDATLRRMRRPYTTAAFAELVAEIRAAVPAVAITTDVIVGFPGESEAEFAESLAFCGRIGFARLHAFPYSPRPGTAAAAMTGQVATAVKRERMAALLAAGDEGRREFERRRAGERAEVLWERRRDGRWLGTTDNYLQVVAGDGLAARPRAVEPVRLAATAAGLEARPLTPASACA